MTSTSDEQKSTLESLRSRLGTEGMPDNSPELREELDSGKIVLVGSVITNDDPTWQCKACDLDIHRESP